MSSKTKLTVSNSATKKFTVDENKNLEIDQKLILDFTKCDTKEYPSNRNDFEMIIKTFQAVNTNNLSSRDDHKLVKKNKGKNAVRITKFINDYKNVHSLDVGHRNGTNGNMRLLYTRDETFSNILHVLDCFIDDHD